MLYIILLPDGSKQILYKQMKVYVRIFIFIVYSEPVFLCYTKLCVFS